MFKKQPSRSSKIKSRARKTLSSQLSPEKKNYVIDTSFVINKFLPKVLIKGLKGKIIVPNAVMAELENQANRGREEGFIGLEEIAKLHKLKNKYKIEIFFEGSRPNEMQIKFAKSGEIDAMIRETARQNKASLLTSDLVQAKTAQAYGLEVLFFKPKILEQIPKKRNFLFWKK